MVLGIIMIELYLFYTSFMSFFDERLLDFVATPYSVYVELADNSKWSPDLALYYTQNSFILLYLKIVFAFTHVIEVYSIRASIDLPDHKL